MSSAELAPLFPSATHPALPIAAQILATLRNLTAPGKGNDLRAEERAALVGVSALLGCERIQSKDLPESSAQKASSVSPAHFRSALVRARRLLGTSTAPTSPSPTRRSARSPSHVSADAADAGPSTKAVDGTAVLAPFTPKKKYKYSSGLDISSLVKSPHSPAKASPLRQSTTASRIASTSKDTVDLGEGGEADDDAEGEQRTPSKRAKYGVKAGVDLESTPIAVPPPSTTITRKRKRHDVSAFLALRPGSRPATADASADAGEEEDEDAEMEYIPAPSRPKKVSSERSKRRKLRPRRDWTYRESLWTGDQVRAANIAKLDEVWARLDNWADNGQREIRRNGGPASVVDILIAALDKPEA